LASAFFSSSDRSVIISSVIVVTFVMVQLW